MPIVKFQFRPLVAVEAVILVIVVERVTVVTVVVVVVIIKVAVVKLVVIEVAAVFSRGFRGGARGSGPSPPRRLCQRGLFFSFYTIFRPKTWIGPSLEFWNLGLDPLTKFLDLCLVVLVLLVEK